MSTPLISIIIPTFNRAHLIGETLDSVLVQTYQNWECIVVDDGSTDNTEVVITKYIEKDSRFKYYHRPNNRPRGGNAARNYGYEVSKGEFINWLDSDDLFLPTKLSEQISYLQHSSAKVHVCQGQIFSFNEKGEKIMESLWPENFPPHGENIQKAMLSGNLRWPSGAALYKRSIAGKVSWNEDLTGAQEWAFHIFQILSSPAAAFKFEEKILIHLRKTVGSITQNPRKTQRFEAYLAARITVLEYLKTSGSPEWDFHFKSIYQFSLRYVKVLVLAQPSASIGKLENLIAQISFGKYIQFKFGVLVYKLSRYDYFLKKLM